MVFNDIICGVGEILHQFKTIVLKPSSFAFMPINLFTLRCYGAPSAFGAKRQVPIAYRAMRMVRSIVPTHLAVLMRHVPSFATRAIDFLHIQQVNIQILKNHLSLSINDFITNCLKCVLYSLIRTRPSLVGVWSKYPQRPFSRNDCHASRWR